MFDSWGRAVYRRRRLVLEIAAIAAALVASWSTGVFGQLQDLPGGAPVRAAAVHPSGTIDPTMPVLMFAIMFGLSMDYEVFLLSRIRERYDITGDTTEAVASGLQRTGGLITSLALLLVIVVGAFSASGSVDGVPATRRRNQPRRTSTSRWPAPVSGGDHSGCSFAQVTAETENPGPRATSTAVSTRPSVRAGYDGTAGQGSSRPRGGPGAGWGQYPTRKKEHHHAC